MIVYCGTNWILQIGCHKEMDSGYLVVHQVNQLSQGLHRLQINHKMSTGHLYQQSAVYHTSEHSSYEQCHDQWVYVVPSSPAESSNDHG